VPGRTTTAAARNVSSLCRLISRAASLVFYTLSPASLEYARTLALVKRWLARYDVLVFRLGRLAVDQTKQGSGLGGGLLLRAAARCIRVADEVGGVALFIDAKNDRAARWYKSYGALWLTDASLSLVLPLATAAAAHETFMKAIKSRRSRLI
jgi:hypothetical protein